MKKLIKKSVLILLFLGLLAAFFAVGNANAFFWQNEPEMTKQEIYENDAQTRELSRQMFIQATTNALKSQKEYAKEKAETAIIEEDTVELERLTKVIVTLNKEITQVQQHTKIAFMMARQ